MRSLLVPLLALAIACPAEKGPSEEFVAAQAAFDRAVDETSDLSFTDPAFDHVVALLEAVPTDAPDRGVADGLLATIRANRAAKEDVRRSVEAAEAAARTAPRPQEVEPAPAAQASAPTPRATEKKTKPIKVYSTSWCPHCKRGIAFLRAKGVPFDERDIERSAGARADRDAFVRFHGVQKAGVPVFDVDGKMLIGFSEASLARLLEEQGYL